MANSNLVKHTEPQPPRPRDFFEVMREEMSRMFSPLDLSRDSWPKLLGTRSGVDLIAPRLNVTETDQEINIEAELPGVDEKDVSVTFANGILTVKGEKKAEREEKKKNYYVNERSFGAFERAIRLPDTVDDGRNSPPTSKRAF